MFITTSNQILNRVPSQVFIGENENFDPANVTDPDFSTLYTSTRNDRLTFDFGVVSNIDYVAFAGTNIANGQDFDSRFTVRDGTTVIARNFVKYNNCCVVTFPRRSFTNLRVGMYNADSSTPPTVRFIAAGQGFNVPNDGENAGYNRQFLNRNLVNRTSVNNQAAPIATLQAKATANGTLSLPNMTKEFSENEWQDFLNFAYSNSFFIREQDPTPTAVKDDGFHTNNNSAYLCFDPRNSKITAHPQTRELNNVSISFKVFNGL